VLSQGAHDLLIVLQVIYIGRIEDEDVIQINHHKRFCEQLQNTIHHPHEFCWSISEEKMHDQPLKEAFFRFEGHLPYIS